MPTNLQGSRLPSKKSNDLLTIQGRDGLGTELSQEAACLSRTLFYLLKYPGLSDQRVLTFTEFDSFILKQVCEFLKLKFEQGCSQASFILDRLNSNDENDLRIALELLRAADYFNC